MKIVKGNVREIDGLKVPIDDSEMISELVSGRQVYH